MTTVREILVPEASLLAKFGKEGDYRDCFVREVAGEVSLELFVERFYGSRAFLPERLVLKALGLPASSKDARAFARGETDRFGAWRLIERKDAEMLAVSKDTNTASWFAVEPFEGGTRLSSSSEAVGQTRIIFGSWVGSIGESGWKALLKPHVWYSRALLGSL